ncbi:putative ATPase [Sphingobacterium faecium PCAi_F2.5]|nr:putative ATPase [Sphingobacterium faecium PCAi_F2.5]
MIGNIEKNRILDKIYYIDNLLKMETENNIDNQKKDCLRKVEVMGLYDVFDHVVELKDENITLILGENGLGKTIILKIIKAFFDKNYNELFNYPYKKIRFTFDNNEVVQIEKQLEDIENNLLFSLWKRKNQKKASATYSIPISQFNRRQYNKRIRNIYENYIDISNYGHDIEYHFNRNGLNFLEKIGRDRWIDLRFNELFSTEEILLKYRDLLPNNLIKELNTKTPIWITQRSDLFEPMLIETQRLLYKSKEGESEYKSSVIKYAQELVEKIKNKTVEGTELSSRLDKNFPNRVISEITKKKKISDSEILEGLGNLSKRRELLNKVGLLDTEEEHFQPIPKNIKGEERNEDILNIVLQVYINDSNDKLEIYYELAKKLEILTDIINKRFLYKTLSINRKNGFVFKSTITEKEIPLGGLSSGEQHELVLFYQLLFNTSSSSLLLIDEPEISLHISWQNHFINDLKEVITLNKFSAIIATHSPDIINNKWDLTVKLKGKK